LSSVTPSTLIWSASEIIEPATSTEVRVEKLAER